VNIPKKINIFSAEYKIILHDGDKWNDSKIEMYGQIIYDKREIHICKNQPDDGIIQTLIHEILHAIIYSLNIEEIENNKNYERIVDTLATGLSDVIIRNKMLK
jgi:Zn-dependent peptidase ImmA (M78 family)